MDLPNRIKEPRFPGKFTDSGYSVKVSHASTPTHHNWFYRKGVLPILALLRMGATPKRLAWSIAVGLLIGINPVLGSTTLFCLAVAFLFRLNVVAVQIANHLMFPLQLILVVPTIRLAELLFHTGGMPISTHVLFYLARKAPFALLHEIWRWEWHAFLLWAAAAVVVVPLIAAGLTPMLRRVLARVQKHEYPIVTIHPGHHNG